MHCAICHEPHGVGDGQLLLFDGSKQVLYSAAKGDVDRIVASVEKGIMPERGAKLTDVEVKTLEDWQKSGAPNN
jgi:mono/diheme cytochrome c family protein